MCWICIFSWNRGDVIEAGLDDGLLVDEFLRSGSLL